MAAEVVAEGQARPSEFVITVMRAVVPAQPTKAWCSLQVVRRLTVAPYPPTVVETQPASAMRVHLVTSSPTGMTMPTPDLRRGIRIP